ncbi:MAG: hypothetical protein HOV92_17785 [Streptomyces sp.]|nr:hypothetical protein [Streptomyces sp.]
MTAEKRPMTATELLDTAEVERLALRPGDALVLKCPHLISDAEFTEISARFKEVFPDTRVLIIEGGADIAVLRAEP